MAKRMIKLITSVADVINTDPEVGAENFYIWQVEPFPVELKWQCIPEGGIVFPKL
jgi:hypothetical protein